MATVWARMTEIELELGWVPALVIDWVPELGVVWVPELATV